MSYEEFTLKVITCPKCNKKMIDAEYWSLYKSFPMWKQKKLEVQILERDMVIRSEIKENYRYLCKNCTDKMEFVCWGCREIRLRKDIKYSFGDTPDFLCIQCYKTETADKWQDLKEEIQENHRWDWD